MQGERQASVRAITGTAFDYNGDWHALFDMAGIPTGSFNGRMLAWINLKLGTSYADVDSAMSAFAIANGATNFSSLGTFDASGGVDDATTALIERMTVAPSAARQQQYNTMIVALKNGGVWSKLDCLYVMAAHDSQAAKLNIVADAFNLTEVSAPSFTADRGFTGNGTSSYLETGFNATTAPSPKYVQNSGHISGWCLTDRAAADTSLMGMRVSTSSYSNIVQRAANGNFVGRINSGPNSLAVTNSLSYGHFIANRSASNAMQGYRNGAQITTISAASVSLINASMLLLARSVATLAPDTFSTDQIAAASIGASLSAAEADALYDALNAYLGAVGAVT